MDVCIWNKCNRKNEVEMTIEKLESFIGLHTEYEAIEEQINNLYGHLASPNGSDVHSNAPSNQTERNALQIIYLKEGLVIKQRQIAKLLEEIEEWLDTVNDAEIRAIVRWHYLLGLSWYETNKKVYAKKDYQYSRMKIMRYFEKY